MAPPGVLLGHPPRGELPSVHGRRRDHAESGGGLRGRDPDENRRLYAEWASSYEETFVAAKAYRYHLHVADTLVAHVRPAGPTLDVGCGTGVVGVALRERGVSEIDGVDISPEMLEQAAMKGSIGS